MADGTTAGAKTPGATTTIRPQLTHVGVWVQDLDMMVEWYCKVLGLTVSDHGFVPRYGGRLTFMTNDPTVHHQVVMGEGRKEGTPSTINQLSFRVRSLDELREINRRALDAGAETMPRNHGNAWSSYFDDPEGNNIEVYLDSPFHVPQPHGDPLDLSLSDEEIERTTLESIKDDPGFMPMKDYIAKRAKDLGTGA